MLANHLKDDVVGQQSHPLPNPTEAIGYPKSMPEWQIDISSQPCWRKQNVKTLANLSDSYDYSYNKLRHDKLITDHQVLTKINMIF